MVKLTDTQLVVLSKAAGRENGLAVALPKMNRAALAKVGSSLVARKLMRELKAKPGMPVWREDEDGRGVSLMITRAGRNAIGVEEDAEAIKKAGASTKKLNKAASGIETPARQGATTPAASSPREGSKQELVANSDAFRPGIPI